MAKLLVLLVALASVLLIADASMRVTTIINERGESCEEQMREQENMRNCQQMMMRQARGGGRYIVNQGMEQDPSFRTCCNEMKQMDSNCRCRNLEEAMRMMQQQGQMQREETQMALAMAHYLPRMCRLKSPQRCEFSSPSLLN